MHKLTAKLTAHRKDQGGFTLIELLVVIGILAILLAITLIAINPNKHFQDTRNTQRSSNVSEVLNGIYEYESANNGNMPASVKYVGTHALPIGQADILTASSASTFSTPDLTLNGLTSNTITSGYVLVSGCTDAANNGDFPVTAGDSTSVTVTNASGVAGDSGCSVTTKVDPCSDLTPTYLADLPTDPKTGSVTGGATPCASGTTAYDTGYTISASNGRFSIAAPSAEDGQTISVTR